MNSGWKKVATLLVPFESVILNIQQGGVSILKFSEVWHFLTF
jgi:hypothetical protein